MRSRKLQITLLTLAIVLLVTMLGAIVVYRATMHWINQALAERNQVGFVVSANAVTFRTPNSELLAPAWNEPVVLADPATFKTIFHSSEFCLGADSKTVFLGEGRRVYRLSGSQASTFRLLTPDGLFACDAQRVYFKGILLPQADPNTFKILGKFTSKDAGQVFIGPAVLEGADPDTFRLKQEGELPDLQVNYSDGPCTVRTFEAELRIKDFIGQDKNKTFRGHVGHW